MAVIVIVCHDTQKKTHVILTSPVGKTVLHQTFDSAIQECNDLMKVSAPTTTFTVNPES